MSINDSGHRPHAIFTDELPRNEIISNAPYNISVTLDTWGPQDNLFPAMYDALQANWGDAPSRTVDPNHRGHYDNTSWPCDTGGHTDLSMQTRTGWHDLTVNQRAYVEKAFAGGTLPQILELITFAFCIDGVTRCFTHQNVRTRIGAAFMQHGGRDNDWRHRPFVLPETVKRLCIEVGSNPADLGEQQSVLDIDVHPTLMSRDERVQTLESYCDNAGTGAHSNPLGDAIEDYLRRGRELYSALVDAGIPWQDARRFLWNGQTTYIHDIYSYPALKGVLANRLEHIMDWEFNCVAQLMLREIKMKCPPLLSKYLGSHSDAAKSAKFAGLDSWPPDGKWPAPKLPCAECGHSHANHISGDNGYHCEVCVSLGRRETNARHGYVAPVDHRMHHRLQNPFWVLHPDSMNGGPIKWVSTNGTYPKEF